MAHPSLTQTEHRPWPLPSSPWVMAQRWSNLLFAHWQVPAEVLRKHLPTSLELDCFEGTAWIGVVPFELRIRPRFSPVVPRIAAFPEINVRTYVVRDGKPGVWFFSLDATSLIAVKVARRQFSLPYFHARIQATSTSNHVRYDSHRTEGDRGADFKGHYSPISDPYTASIGTLDAWLTERYCLYACDSRGRVSRTDVHHLPWPLQRAECVIDENTMTAPVGIELAGPPLVHFAKSIEVINWLPERIF